jgi:hypothetical protein
MVYRAPYPQSTTSTTTLELVATIPWGGATGGDVSYDGSLIIVRGYSSASVWRWPAGTALWEAFAQSPCDVPLRSERQGEAIGWDPEGLGYYTVSEDESSNAQIPIWYFARDAY